MTNIELRRRFSFINFPINEDKVVQEIEDEYDLSGDESILVVDDEELQRMLIKKLLTKFGYKVQVAKNGRESLRMLVENQYDLIILDMKMEDDFDGLDTYREIIKIKSEQKVLISSGYVESERVEEALILGANNYLKKPFTMKQLGIIVINELRK